MHLTHQAWSLALVSQIQFGVDDSDDLRGVMKKVELLLRMAISSRDIIRAPFIGRPGDHMRDYGTIFLFKFWPEHPFWYRRVFQCP